MFRSLVAASLLAAASPLASQVHHSPSVDPKVAALRDAALDGDRYAWDITEGLTTEVGQRMAGTEAEAFLEQSGCRWLAKPFRLRELVRVAREVIA